MDTLTKLRNIMLENTNIDVSSLSLSTNLQSDLSLDSLGMVELAVYIEDEFNIKLSDEKIESFETIKDIVEYIENTINK